MPSTATIRDVELVSVGTWAASTGVTKVTREDLEAMLSAHRDGLVDHAPIKLGHVSPLNDDLGDGAPAYGWVVPTGIRTNAAGLDTLVGDLVGMPAKLAEVAPTAYRRRSVEIAWQVKTPAGKTYAAALIGVALLGVAAPAVKGLADLVKLYSEDPAEVGRTDRLELVDGLEGNTVAVAMLAAARQAGAPVEQLDAMADAAGARDTADVPPATADPDNDDTDSTAQGGTETTDTGGTTMTDEELRAALNLAADADVNAELTRILGERGTDPATASTDPAVTPEGNPATDPATPGTPAPQTTPQGDPVEDPAGDPQHAGEPQLVQLSAANYAELTALAERERTRRRAEALDGAIRAGRIAPAERASFAAQMDRDEEGTITLLGSLAPRFAVTEVGDDRAQEAQLSEAAADAFDEFEASVFGLERGK